METQFPDVKPFPKAEPVYGGMGHNRPPLNETIVEDFMSDLQRQDGLIERLDQLAVKGADPKPCADDEMAGRYADFIRMCSAGVKAVEAQREVHNRPILEAQRALKGKADALTAPVALASRKVRTQLDAYTAEKSRKEAEERRKAEEAARAAREAAAALEAETGEPMPAPIIEAAKVESAPIRSDMGSTVSTTTRWKHEIESVRQLPDRILKNPRVIEALDKVIAAEIRAGAREIKGVKLWSEQAAVVR